MSRKIILFVNIWVGILIFLPYNTPLTYNSRENTTTVNDSCTATSDGAHYVCTFYDVLNKNSDFKIIVRWRVMESVEFKIEKNQYFDIESVKNGNNGDYYYIGLNVLDTIAAPFNQLFKITAWDKKKTEEDASLTVEIQIVETVFATFIEPSYYGEVTEDLIVVIYNGPIELNGGDINDYNIVVSREYEAFFVVTLFYEEIELYLSEQGTLQTLPEFPIDVTLIATDRYLGKTAETIVTLDGPFISTTKEEQEAIISKTSLTTSVDENVTYNSRENLTIVNDSCEGITFDRPSYVFVVYDFLTKTFDFGFTGLPKIVVRGCIGASVEFKIEENQYIAIESDKHGNNRQHYYARLRALDTIKAPFNRIFSITAWDKERAEQVASATVEIRIVKTYFARFVQSIYYGRITEDLNIVIDNGPIMLDGADIKDFDIVILEEYGNFFDVKLFFEEIEVHFSQQQTLQTLPEFPINLTLVATDRYVGETIETTVTLYGP